MRFSPSTLYSAPTSVSSSAMKRCRVSDDSHATDILLKNERIPCSSEALDSLWIPNSSPFHGTSASMVNFEQAGGERNNNRSGSEQESDCKAENCDDEFEQRTGKKRRLTAEQVQFLEKSFDVDNKLEPDRKSQLAKKLGLQPRQVAIWFQNRRARSKSKVLEKEYDSLKSCYHKLKADYDNLFSDNEKLRNEVNLLSQKLVVKENDPISPLDFATKGRSSSPAICKPEEASSYSSHVVESEDEDHECLLVQRLCLPKLEDQYYDDLQPNSCNLGFPVQNQGTWFWQC